MFLIEQEEDYLEKSGKNEEALPENLWHPDFKYEKVLIPKKELPIHPKQSDVDIRSEKGVDEIKNPHIRSFPSRRKKMKWKEIVWVQWWKKCTKLESMAE